MAEGSHATWGDMPRVCAGCGKPLRITKDTLWLDTFHGQSWHAYCRINHAFDRLWEDEPPQDRLHVE